MKDAYNTIEDSKHGHTIAITGPPSKGEDGDIEVENENKILRYLSMPDEVVREFGCYFSDESSGSGEECKSSQPLKKMKRKDQPKWT